MIPSKIKIESFAKRCHMGTLGGKGLNNWQILIFFNPLPPEFFFLVVFSGRSLR